MIDGVANQNVEKALAALLREREDDVLSALSEYAQNQLNLKNARFQTRAENEDDVFSRVIAADLKYAVHIDKAAFRVCRNPACTLSFEIDANEVEDGRAFGERALSQIYAFCEGAKYAVANALNKIELKIKSRELESVYAIDAIRDQPIGFELKLKRSMAHMFKALNAEVGILSKEPNDDALIFATNTSKNSFDTKSPEVLHLLERTRQKGKACTRPCVEKARLFDRDVFGLAFTDEAVPKGALLVFANEGVFFDEADERVLIAIASQLDTAIFDKKKEQKLKDVFRRYVSDDVFQHILKSDEDLLRGSRREVTCFFSDLRGFTSVSERLPTEEVVAMLNEHFVEMCSIVFDSRGTVDKLIGDCVMAFFGAPLELENHTLAAVRAACKMREAHNVIAEGWSKRGLPPVQVGIGLHLGEVFVGSIGGEQLSSYTIIGDHVNLAARLEGVSLGNDIIVSRDVVDALGDKVRAQARGIISVKGKSEPIEIYNVLGVD